MKSRGRNPPIWVEFGYFGLHPLAVIVVRTGGIIKLLCLGKYIGKMRTQIFIGLVSFFLTATAPSQTASKQSLERLELTRELMRQERWEDAREQLGKINKSRAPLGSAIRAETNYRYGLCLEMQGNKDDSQKVYNAVIAVYRSQIEWSSQALERGFELAYQNKDPEERVKAYRYLRKILWIFEGYVEEETLSGALTRLRKRLPVIKNELGLSSEQSRKIDVKLGLNWTHLSMEGEDATSKHYYFYNSDIGSDYRVRWVWNGGAQNRPTVTDYILDSGKITIRHLVGDRDTISELILGGVAELELKEEYSIDSQYSVEERRLIDSKKPLTEKRKIDIENLADLLTRHREEICPEAEEIGHSRDNRRN